MRETVFRRGLGDPRSTCLMDLLKDLKFVIFLNMFEIEFQSFGPIKRTEFKPYVVDFGLGSERI